MKYVLRKRTLLVLVRFIDFFGYGFIRLFSGLANRTGVFKSILVIRLDHIGDCLWSTPVPKILKESFPQAKVIFLTNAHGAALLQGNPFVDEVMIYEAPWFRRQKAAKRGDSLSYLGLARILRRKKIEAAIGLRGDIRENLLMALAGIKRRVGFGITGGGFLLTDEVPYRRLGHVSERNRELLRAIGAGSDQYEPKIYTSNEEENAFLERFESFGMKKGGRYVAIQLDAGTKAKQWPPGYWEEFLRRFEEQLKDSVPVLVGSKSSDLSGTFGGQKGQPSLAPINLVGKTSLRELCLLMKYLTAFVGMDSGPSHLAAVMGVPTVFIFSGTNRLEEWKPFAEKTKVLSHAVPCSPCHLTVCNVKGHPCLSEIKPEEVLKALKQLMNGAA